jgi:hypothetical protein
MQLQNIQQQTTKCIEVYYVCLLKLANCLHVRPIDFFIYYFQSRIVTLLHISHNKYETKYLD